MTEFHLLDGPKTELHRMEHSQKSRGCGMLLVSRLALTKMRFHAKMLREKQPTTHFPLFYYYHCLPWSLRLPSAATKNSLSCSKVTSNISIWLIDLPIASQAKKPRQIIFHITSTWLPWYYTATSIFNSSFSIHSTTNCVFFSYLIPSLELAKLVK